ncbi:MAG: hypothetical protein M3R55_00930 [Acidobacteriota bacterium]|nr:hypothetical protein [Acidobacteriota bacterium]
MRRFAFIPIAAALLTFAACSKHTPPETSPVAESGFVGGTITMSRGDGGSLPSVLVSVTGHLQMSSANRNGDFVIANVPAGPLELRFTGDGIAAVLPLDPIAAGETVTLAVRLTPVEAAADAIARVRGTDATIEGRVQQPATELPANTILVGGRTVLLPPGTEAQGGAALTPGTRVRVAGTVSAAGLVVRSIEIR